MSKAEELTREVIEHLMPDAGVTFQATSQRAIEATLLKYGCLVQEAAAKKADAEIDTEWPNDDISVRAKIIGKSIRFMELP